MDTVGAQEVAYWLVGVAIGAGVGALIGGMKNRTGLGAVLGGLLGCLGWLIIALIPRRSRF